MGGLKQVANVAPRVAFGHAGQFWKVDVVIESEVLGVYGEHVHPGFDGGQWYIDPFLESSDEGLVNEPGLVRRADQVNMIGFLLVQYPAHLLEELVSNPDFPTTLFSPGSHQRGYSPQQA